MGKGIDLARAAGAGIHADVLESFKEDLLIILAKRLQGDADHLAIPVAEVDGAGAYTLSFAVRDGTFIFVVERKQ